MWIKGLGRVLNFMQTFPRHTKNELEKDETQNETSFATARRKRKSKNGFMPIWIVSPKKKCWIC